MDKCMILPLSWTCWLLSQVGLILPDFTLILWTLATFFLSYDMTRRLEFTWRSTNCDVRKVGYDVRFNGKLRKNGLVVLMDLSSWCHKGDYQARYNAGLVVGRDLQINDILTSGEVRDLHGLLNAQLWDLINVLENPNSENWERIIFELKTVRWAVRAKSPSTPSM